jgi:hypothetical protein
VLLLVAGWASPIGTKGPCGNYRSNENAFGPMV